MVKVENQDQERLREKERGGRDGLGAKHQKCCLDLFLKVLLTYFVTLLFIDLKSEGK